MRARYSAYPKKEYDFIVNTTHPANPSYNGSKTRDGKHSSTLREDVVATAKSFEFVQLEVLETRPGREGNVDEGYVGFRASCVMVGQKGARQKGSQVLKKQTMDELSRFVREEGRWLYVDGDTDWQLMQYGKMDKFDLSSSD